MKDLIFEFINLAMKSKEKSWDEFKDFNWQTNFVDLGFGSIEITQFAEQVSNRFNIEIHPGTFFEYQTPEKFIEYLNDYHREEIDKQNLKSSTDSLSNSNNSERFSLSLEMLQNKARKIFEKQDLEADHNFLSIGGTPDQFEKLTNWLIEDLGLEINPGLLFEKNTLNLLFEHIKNNIDESVFELNKVHIEESKLAKEHSFDVIDKLDQDKIPIVVGSGISGMLISKKLSSMKINHIILGDKKNGDSPILGESMNEVTSLELREFYPEYADCLFNKRSVTGFCKDKVFANDFTEFFLGALYKSFNCKNLENNSLIHIDRHNFDEKLWKDVSDSDYVKVLDLKVKDIKYNQADENIEKIILENNDEIVPSFVFDATNHIRLLGKKLNLDCHEYDDQRIVFFTNYMSIDTNNTCNTCFEDESEEWLHATNLLFAEDEFDGLDGVSWLIPQGKHYVSIGISMLEKDLNKLSREEIITRLCKSYKKRGINIELYYPRRKEILSIPSQHFKYNKIYGKNWVLAGGAASQAWFPSASNIGLSVVLAKVADKIISDTANIGRLYEEHVNGFTYAQEYYSRFINGKRTKLDIANFLAEVYEGARRRFAHYCLFRDEEKVKELAIKYLNENKSKKANFFVAAKGLSGAVNLQPENFSDQTKLIYQELAKIC